MIMSSYAVGARQKGGCTRASRTQYLQNSTHGRRQQNESNEQGESRYERFVHRADVDFICAIAAGARMIAWLMLAVATVFGRDVYKDDVPRALAAIVAACEATPILGSPRTCAAFLASIAWHESRFRINALGAHYDCGLFQHVAQSRAECDALRTDPLLAAQVALFDVQRSINACGKGRELNAFATGDCSKGQRVTVSRMARAAQIERVVE
jgi:hypothetical protein